MASKTLHVATPCGMLRRICAMQVSPLPRVYAPSITPRHALAMRACVAVCDEIMMMVAMTV
eukprot:3043595-Pleurochrysis_carterae.AAC.1